MRTTVTITAKQFQSILFKSLFLVKEIITIYSVAFPLHLLFLPPTLPVIGMKQFLFIKPHKVMYRHHASSTFLAFSVFRHSQHRSRSVLLADTLHNSPADSWLCYALPRPRLVIPCCWPVLPGKWRNTQSLETIDCNIESNHKFYKL